MIFLEEIRKFEIRVADFLEYPLDIPIAAFVSDDSNQRLRIPYFRFKNENIWPLWSSI